MALYHLLMIVTFCNFLYRHYNLQNVTCQYV
nr:MAG TPA: hypothetical protein [Caudoviricetes sp.]